MSTLKKQKSKPPAKAPPRSLYTKEKARRICEAIAEGGQINSIARELGVGRRTIYAWQAKHPQFKADMADARALHLDYLQDRIRELCAALHEIAGSGRETARLEIEAAKIEIDAVKWELCKLLPRKYGDKSQMEITGKDGAALLPEHTREQDAAFAALIAAAQAKTPPPRSTSD